MALRASMCVCVCVCECVCVCVRVCVWGLHVGGSSQVWCKGLQLFKANLLCSRSPTLNPKAVNPTAPKPRTVERSLKTLDSKVHNKNLATIRVSTSCPVAGDVLFLASSMQISECLGQTQYQCRSRSGNPIPKSFGVQDSGPRVVVIENGLCGLLRSRHRPSLGKAFTLSSATLAFW